jgi:hypothetical protein
MSIEVMSWVWKKSKATGTTKFVLLAIADNAWDDGSNAWPSITTISKKTGLSERTVQRCIQNLFEMDELRIFDRPGHSNLYKVNMDEAQTESTTKKPGKGIATIERLPVEKKDEIWDTLMLVCGVDQKTINSQERGRHNKAVKALKESGATTEQIIIRSKIYKQRFPNAAFTPIAFASHWSELDPQNQTTNTQQVPAGWNAIQEARQQRGA